MVRYLEITSTIEAILRERKKISDREFVFSRTGNSVTHYHKILRESAAACGSICGEFERGGFIAHDARHTAVTRMLQAGVGLSTVSSITGHSHATRESRKQAISILKDFVVGEKSAKVKKTS